MERAMIVKAMNVTQVFGSQGTLRIVTSARATDPGLRLGPC